LSLFYVLPAIWGIVTVVGLFRLRNWARISILVFSVLLLVMSLFGLLTAALIRIPMQGGTIDPGMRSFVDIVMVAFNLVPLAIAIWWLVFFSRPGVKQQFVTLPPHAAGDVATGDYAAVTPIGAPRTPSRPLSITILAWFLLVGSVMILVNLPLRSPAIFFVLLLTGPIAMAYYAVAAALQVSLGIGLLRLNPLSRTLTMAYLAYGALNVAAFNFAPGGRSRVQALLNAQETMFPWMRVARSQAAIAIDPAVPMVVGSAVGLGVFGVWVYFLITRKQAFEKTTLNPAG
jgi:hypothetical protein